MRKDIDLGELCSTMLTKVPQLNIKDIDNLKKSVTSFNVFLLNELNTMLALLTDITGSLKSIKRACELSNYGDLLSDQHQQVADDLYHVRIPDRWRHLAGGTAPPAGHSLPLWLTDLQNRCAHYERILALGREKMPAYWLGAFFHPRGLLSLLIQDCCRYQTTNARSGGSLESYVFQTELTQRDKDHIRDPPNEGFFVFGLFLWGAIYDKSSGQLIDPTASAVSQQSRSSYPMSAQPSSSTGPSTLPVIHVMCWPRSERPLPPPPDGVPAVTAARAAAAAGLDFYICPVYLSRSSTGSQRCQSILELELPLSGLSASKWLLRGLSATVRPF
jgi:dynein heavy chain